MENNLPGVFNAQVCHVEDDAYLFTIKRLLLNARKRLFVSLFIVDISPYYDRSLTIDGLLEWMSWTHWRGVPTRLVIGGSQENQAIARSADVARTRCMEFGIPCRWLTSTNVKGSHAKLVVADDYVLLGSHNWSYGAMSNQTQDSILVRHQDLADYFSQTIEYQWQRGRNWDATVPME